MSIDRAGWPFISVPAVLAAGGLWLGFPVPAAILGGLTLFMVFFFRDPHRSVPLGTGLVVAPADGKVMIAGDSVPEAAPPGNWKQISIFLSPIDVHINRIPIGGRVTKVEYKPGRFLAAYRWEAASQNERNDGWIDHDGVTLICRQVVGVLARRLVCRVHEGDQVQTGARYGLMKFGSRIDLFLPARVQVRVAAGDRVRSGETVVAQW